MDICNYDSALNMEKILQLWRNAQSYPKHYNVIYFKIFMNLAVF